MASLIASLPQRQLAYSEWAMVERDGEWLCRVLVTSSEPAWAARIAISAMDPFHSSMKWELKTEVADDSEEVVNDVRRSIARKLCDLQSNVGDPMICYPLDRHGVCIWVSSIEANRDPNFAAEEGGLGFCPLVAHTSYIAWGWDFMGAYEAVDKTACHTPVFLTDGELDVRPSYSFNEVARRILIEKVREKLTDRHWELLREHEELRKKNYDLMLQVMFDRT